MFKLNNKGYMLVEIILASVIAFGVAYVVINLTMKLKNKNDDLLVETQVKTDQAIITNKLMEYAIASGEDFDCSKLSVNDKQIKYDEEVIDIVNDYTTIVYDPSEDCENNTGKININMGLNVPQMADKDFDVQVEYKYEIGDMEPPTCTLKVTNSTISFDTKEDNPNGSGVGEFGIVKGTDETYNNDESIEISASNTYTGFIKDKAGNSASCSISIHDIKYDKKSKTCLSSSSCQCSAYKQHVYFDNKSQSYCNSQCAVSCYEAYDSYGLNYYVCDYYYCPDGYSYGDYCIKYNQSDCGSWHVDSCNTSYSWGTETSSNNVTSCSASSISCDSGNVNKTNVTCTPKCTDSGYTLTDDKKYCYKII